MGLTILDGVLFGIGFTLGSFILGLPLALLGILVGTKHEN